VVNIVLDSMREVIRENINVDGFELKLKLPSFGKFVVRHRQGSTTLITNWQDPADR
jgi:hypothetical protein